MGRGRSKAGKSGGGASAGSKGLPKHLSSSGKNVLKVSAANVKNMTTAALYSERENNNLTQEAIKNVMSQIASENTAGMGMPKEYYDARKTLTKLQQRSTEITLEIGSRASQEAKTKAATKKTFINSFGEATSRDITSASYKRALKRTEKAVLKNLGY